MPASRDKIPVPLPSSNINHPCPSPRMNKKNRPGTHPNYDMGMDRDAKRSLSVPPTPCILTRKTVFLEVGGVVDGLWCLSRCPQALPLRSSQFFSPARFFTARPLFSLIYNDQEPGTGQLPQKLQKLSRTSGGDSLRAQTYFRSSLLFTWNVKRRDDQ